MKTLSKHNNQIHNYIIQKNKANVLCDDCNVEMFYTEPYTVLECDPPKKTVQCPKCNKIDYKLIWRIDFLDEVYGKRRRIIKQSEQ